MTEQCLTVSGLEKSYDGRSVLNGLDFEVNRGEIVALLGVNGAGKTTTLECVMGLRRPDAGSVRVDGTLAAQLQTGSLPDYLRGRELLELFSRWNGRPVDPALAARLGAEGFLERQYRTMSVGQKRRLQLMLALMREPALLLLDEPTAGLDIEGRIAVHQEILAKRDQGAAILLSTHDLTEAKDVCDRLILLRDGQIAFAGTPAEFADAAGRPASVCVRTPQGKECLPAADIAHALAELLQRLSGRNVPVLDVWVERGTLEEQFIELTKGA
ncbi:MAG: ABC transporter ATP-binding protein [Clostridia bacterium]|nr:ABC transporter ATP-binding protein [Clostridia bacterium]